MAAVIRLSMRDLTKLIDQAKQFATWQNIRLSDIAIDLTIGINREATISRQDWEEGEPFQTIHY